MSALYPDVASMLRAHGINGAEQPFPSADGYSGARFSAVMRGQERFVLKRITADDWPLADVHDPDYREAQFAVADVPLPASVDVATIAASHDGPGRALLMRDVSDGMLVGSEVISEDIATRVLHGIAALHALYWGAPPNAPVNWYPPAPRLTLISPAIGRMLVEQGRDFGLERGWQSFARRKPKLWRRIAPLFDDPSPIVNMMATRPQTLLHGDLKFGNMSIEGERLILIDWSGVTVGPMASDIGWFLPVNSSRLPWTLDETLERYRDALFRALIKRDLDLSSVDWAAQLVIIYVVGLMLYGWGKALDADGGNGDELDWWCERATAALNMCGL